MQVSVVIITKNEAANIAECIASARLITNDIIVVDSGSCDDTVFLAECSGADVISILWNGYGNARNIGANYALHNWILALDADERITPELARCISQLHLNQPQNVYGFHRLNFVKNKQIRYGALRFDKVFRLYNKTLIEWQDVSVHELLTGHGICYNTLPQKLLHYGSKDLHYYWQKKMNYAFLWAKKQQQKRKDYSYTKHIASTITSFIKGYIFQLGFLDYQYGFKIAKMNAAYTWHKYSILSILLKSTKIKKSKKYVEEDSLFISSATK